MVPGWAEAARSPADQTVLEAGMVVNVEVPYYEIGFGGMQLEDTLRVTSADPTVLGRIPRELRSLRNRY